VAVLKRAGEQLPGGLRQPTSQLPSRARQKLADWATRASRDIVDTINDHPVMALTGSSAAQFAGVK
jgi:hypothetical protein